MTASTSFKGVLAGLAAVAIAGTALAQSTPPDPDKKDPAVGAGQQSTQATPMGTTGTPPGGGTAGSTAAGTSGTGTSGSTSTDTTTSPSTAGSSTGSGSTMGASGSSTTTTTTTTDTATSDTQVAKKRTMRADRN